MSRSISYCPKCGDDMMDDYCCRCGEITQKDYEMEEWKLPEEPTLQMLVTQCDPKDDIMVEVESNIEEFLTYARDLRAIAEAEHARAEAAESIVKTQKLIRDHAAAKDATAQHSIHFGPSTSEPLYGVSEVELLRAEVERLRKDLAAAREALGRIIPRLEVYAKPLCDRMVAPWDDFGKSAREGIAIARAALAPSASAPEGGKEQGE
jgi:hypothetical protein